MMYLSIITKDKYFQSPLITNKKALSWFELLISITGTYLEKKKRIGKQIQFFLQLVVLKHFSRETKNEGQRKSNGKNEKKKKFQEN